MGGEENRDAVSKPMEYPGREQPYEHRFSPYDFNGGTVAGVSGEDYLVIAADTRMSSGFEIISRNTTKLHQLNPNAILASSGCKTDMDQLRSVLDIKAKVSTERSFSFLPYYLPYFYAMMCLTYSSLSTVLPIH